MNLELRFYVMFCHISISPFSTRETTLTSVGAKVSKVWNFRGELSTILFAELELVDVGEVRG